MQYRLDRSFTLRAKPGRAARQRLVSYAFQHCDDPIVFFILKSNRGHQRRLMPMTLAIGC